MATTKRKPKKVAKKRAGSHPSSKTKGKGETLPLRDSKGRFIKAKKPERNKKAARKKPDTVVGPLVSGKSNERPSAPVQVKLAKPHKPRGKQTAKAKTEQGFKAPQYPVTSNTERLITIHTELRNKAIKEQRLFIPDERLRKVEDPYRKALKKSLTVSKFLTEKSLEEIVYQTAKHLQVVAGHSANKREPRYTVELNMTEYGITLYGSDKGEIARVDGLRSEALHWSKWSTKASESIETVMASLESGLHRFLDKKVQTTLCIESVNVTMLYDSKERESGQ